MKMKILTAVFISVSAVMLNSCDDEKTFDDWGDPYPVLSDNYTMPEPSDPSTLTGNYDIISFMRETNGECISYAKENTEQTPQCTEQIPAAPAAVRGKVMLDYDKNTGGMYIAYKYDILDNGSYYPIYDKSGELISYVHDGNGRIANFFQDFKIGEQAENGRNNLLIESFAASQQEPVLPKVTLVTDRGNTTYTFALKKENDMSVLYDTHTPINTDDVTEDFEIQKPINLEPSVENCDPNTNVNGCFSPFGLFGYYKITAITIYNADEYIADMNNAVPVYNTDNRNGTKFKGEFWIKEPNNFLSELLPADIVNLAAYIKYQIEPDPAMPLPEGVQSEILAPELIEIKLPLQNKQEDGTEIKDDLPKMIAQTFRLLAQWDETWPDRARKIIYKPRPETFDGKDNINSLLYFGGNKEYAAVLTIEQMYGKEYSDKDGTAANMLNFNDLPYWSGTTGN